jgi:hypothetical protein
MSMATGVVLFVIGAILAFAVHANLSFISLGTVGYILMAGGAIVFVIGLALTLRGRLAVTSASTAPDGTQVVRERVTDDAQL